MLRVGIIGYGTAGRDVVEAIQAGRAGDCEVASVLVRNRSKYPEADGPAVTLTDDTEAFFAEQADVIVETAGHGAVSQYGRRALQSGSDFMLVSVGALGDPALLDDLATAATIAGRRIHLPSAAIAGLDRIAAAAQGPLDHVRLTTRKPVAAWRGTYAEQVVRLDEVLEPVTIFEGDARASSQLFPESVNVSAALSLAGIGFERTEVRVVVDPHIERNVHEISAAGKFGSVRIEVENTPSPSNPKTGYIVAMSICKALRGLSSPWQIGV